MAKLSLIRWAARILHYCNSGSSSSTETSNPLWKNVNLYIILCSWIVCSTRLRTAQQEISRLAGGCKQFIVSNVTFWLRHPNACPPKKPSKQEQTQMKSWCHLTWLGTLHANHVCTNSIFNPKSPHNSTVDVFCHPIWWKWVFIRQLIIASNYWA